MYHTVDALLGIPLVAFSALSHISQRIFFTIITLPYSLPLLFMDFLVIIRAFAVILTDVGISFLIERIAVPSTFTWHNTSSECLCM